MSNKLRIQLIIVLAICMIACTFTGCSIGFMTYNEFLDEYDIAAQVTYYGNGGYFSENTSIVSVEVSYTTGSKIYTPTVGTSAQQIMRYNYDLVGWYNVAQRTYAETGDDGEEEQVLYFVLDITDDEVEAYKHTENGETVYYFEYTSELTTGTTAEDDDEDDSTSTDSSTSTSSDEDDFDDDAEIDTSYLTQRMYYVKDSDSKWIMSQEDYDYYVRLRKEYNTDTSISVPNLELGDEMDGTITLEDGEHLYMVADWVKSVSINYVLVMKDGETATSISITSSGTTSTVNEGEVIYNEYFGTQSSITRTDASGLPITINDATVLAFYYDEACTQRVNGATVYKPTEDEYGNTEDVTLYALCIAGIYTVVRDDSGVQSMFRSGASNYYIFANDKYVESKIIDCSGITVSPLNALSCKIEGNGYTISNLTVTNSKVDGDVSLFGSVYDGAAIHDLTFDNVTIEYQTSNTQFVNIYLVAFAGQYETGNTTLDIDITGLTIKNVEVYITLAQRSGSSYTTIRNMQYQSDTGTYETDNWLYGDDNTDDIISYTDADFVSAYGGATVESSKVYIRQGLDGEYVTAVSVE